jgi:hypothetical protein
LEKFSLLSKVAKIIICVKGASTATERDFSASGLVESVRSNSSRNSINGSINTSVFKIIKVISIIQSACVDLESEFEIFIAILLLCIIYVYAFNV